MVGDWLVGRSMVRRFNKTQEKSCLVYGFPFCTLVEVYFVILLLFSYIHDKEETNLIARSIHSKF